MTPVPALIERRPAHGVTRSRRKHILSRRRRGVIHKFGLHNFFTYRVWRCKVRARAKS
nr:MAG TPA: hypothetical protein [Caudoviricetes sp.]